MLNPVFMFILLENILSMLMKILMRKGNDDDMMVSVHVNLNMKTGEDLGASGVHQRAPGLMQYRKFGRFKGCLDFIAPP